MEPNTDRLPLSSSSSFKSSSLPPDISSHLDLYTIPSHSFWFSWDSIHDTERIELREFFDGSSFTRTPKIYKEYRDFIICKYREDPSRRLTFTEVRKSLVGDVCILNKVFNFLDKWGLINFGAPPPPPPTSAVVEGVDEEVKVRVEEGPPIGVRVVGTPNTLKPLKEPLSAPGADGGGGVDNGFKLPPLASYSVVFEDLEGEKGVACGNCKEKCESKYYECTKDKCILCLKCFEKGEYGENKSSDDFKLNDSIESSVDQGGVWTETETLLLLEAILKHGDDWELVAQNVKTKTKLECISRLIELPFGELMLGSSGKCSARALDAGQEQKASGLYQENSKMELCHHQDNQHLENNHHKEENNHQQEIVVRENAEDIENLEPPLKKSRIDSSDPSRSLMEQVALISTMVAPQITATAADAAVSVLCDGNPLLREIFYSDDHISIDKHKSGNLDMEMERAFQSEDQEMDTSHPSEIDKLSQIGDSIPIALRMRAAVATALGAAAAHAKILADQEEREIEHWMAFIVEAQLKKLQCKVKYMEDLEDMMEKEHVLIEESKDDIIEQRLATLQKKFDAGIFRPRDHNL
ncbi:SWI/SNF complex subunit SWI3A-like isoform X2 [Chenopodium quinoa]|uniref:SWI/SNF complex subunit SWI3A-like isoform X2 n=1 Tax=Chenopodium quinoa TaxID=63459 RepID=UPI000B784859|nr:SWI/SNF complex subunit SWI3A-like isoform X2 [Chenopodium quinoa]